MRRLYLVTRADLPAGAQAVQAAHAAMRYACYHPHYLPETVVVLACPDVLELAWLLDEAQLRELTAEPFYEPDLGDALTAVALEPGAARLCRKYPLALKGIQPC